MNLNLTEIENYINNNFNFKTLSLYKIIWNIYICFNPKAKYKNFNNNFFNVQLLDLTGMELFYFVTLNTSLVEGNTASKVSFIISGGFSGYTTNKKYTKLSNFTINFIL